MSPKFAGKEEKKLKKKKNYSQTVGNWCVMFLSMRGSERTCLGTFLNKLRTCLQMKSICVYGSPVPRKRISHCLLTKGRAPPGTLPAVPDERILTNRQNSHHLFLQKSLCFIFNPSTVISQFSLLGKACQGAMTTLFFLPQKSSLFCQSHIPA